MYELSVVVPCLSSQKALPEFFDALAGVLMKNPTDVDVVVVAHKTPEDPQTCIAYVQSRYPWLRFTFLQRKGGSCGYGALARFGIAYSSSRYVALVSPYNEDDVGILLKMLDEVRRGAQLVQATRFAQNDSARVPWKFRVYQSIYRFMVRLLTQKDITDSTYAYKLFDRTFVQALGLTQNGYSVCPEITLKSVLADGNVAYVPTQAKTSPLNKYFSLVKEGFGYARVLARAALHRVGLSWF